MLSKPEQVILDHLEFYHQVVTQNVQVNSALLNLSPGEFTEGINNLYSRCFIERHQGGLFTYIASSPETIVKSKEKDFGVWDNENIRLLVNNLYAHGETFAEKSIGDNVIHFLTFINTTHTLDGFYIHYEYTLESMNDYLDYKPNEFCKISLSKVKNEYKKRKHQK